MTSYVIDSTDRQYRHSLTINVTEGSKSICWIALYPSKRSIKKDVTINRCISLTQSFEYNRLTIVSLFDLKAMSTSEILTHSRPFSDVCDTFILQQAVNSDLVIAAWGDEGKLFDRDLTVENKLREIRVYLHVLKLTSKGNPAKLCHLKQPFSITPYHQNGGM